MLEKIKDQRGLTLIELLVTTAIMAMIIGAMTGVLTAGLKSFTKAGQTDEVQQNARVAVNKTVSALRDALSIDTTNTKNDQIVFQYKYHLPGNKSLVTVRIIRVNNLLYWEDWPANTANFNNPALRIDQWELAADVTGIQIYTVTNNFIDFAVTAAKGVNSINIRNGVFLRQ